jgi:hypothetical protein
MEATLFIIAFSITFFFLFITVKQTIREYRYYSYIAEEDALYYEELFKEMSQ